MPTNKYPMAVENGGLAATNQPVMVQDADTNLQKWVAQFDPSAENRLHYAAYIPPNYLTGALTFRIRWRANAATGDCIWKIYAISGAPVYALHGTAASTATVTTTTSGTANNINESVITITPTALAADTILHFVLARDAAAGGDTLSVVAELLEFLLEFAVDGSITKNYLLIPVQAFTIPAASGVSLVAPNIGSDSGGIILPRTLKFPDAANNYADFQFTIPSNFNGQLKCSTLAANDGSSTGSWNFHVDLAKAAVGGDSDPSLSTGVTFTTSPSGGFNQIAEDKQRAAIVSPSAGDHIFGRITRDNSDTNSTNVYLYGLCFEYEITSKRPQTIRLDPGSSAQPNAAPAVIQKDDDTNTSKFVASFTDGLDLSADFVSMIPSTYLSGGTLRIRWRSSASAGNAYIEVDYGSPASGAASDPALTAGSPAAYATAGANLINEIALDVSAGLAASDMFHCRITRLASNILDTLGADLEILSVVLETNV